MTNVAGFAIPSTSPVFLAVVGVAWARLRVWRNQPASPKRDAADFGKVGSELGIGEVRIDRLVKLLEDLGGRVPRRAEAGPGGRLVARHELAKRRDVWQRL